MAASPGATSPIDDEQLAARDRPDVSAERRALGQAIEHAVEQLAPEIRATFVLRAYHDLDYAEIAQVLEVDLGTVKSRLWRARSALKALLAEVHREQ